MTPINDFKTYVSGMQKSIEDKLFFLEHIDKGTEAILDYGCADGSLLNQVNLRNKGYRLIGYDLDDEMISAARKKSSGYFSTDFASCVSQTDTSETIINLSSVIHEIYSYTSQRNIKEFWDRVFCTGFKYVSIRDFCLKRGMRKQTPERDLEKVLDKADEKMVSDFEKIWGGLDKYKNFIHFLMKYRYIENWDREVRENYFPLTLEYLKEKIPEEYEIVYEESYILPFTKRKITEDFGVNLEDTTHVKLLLKKRLSSASLHVERVGSC